MSMAEIWCLCDEPAPARKLGDLTEAEAAELHALLHEESQGRRPGVPANLKTE